VQTETWGLTKAPIFGMANTNGVGNHLCGGSGEGSVDPVTQLELGIAHTDFCSGNLGMLGEERRGDKNTQLAMAGDLGEASFGLYLIHMTVHHLFLWMHWQTSKSLWLVYLVSCVVLSLMSLYWVEKPARQWILKKFHARTKESLLTASSAQ